MRLAFPSFRVSQHAFGLDISDLVLRVIALKRRGRRFTVAAYQELLLPPGLIEEGVIARPDEVSNRIRMLLQRALPSPIHRQCVIASLPDRQTFVKLIQVPAGVATAPPPSLIQQELTQHIPFSVEDVYYDWQTIGNPGHGVQSVLIGAAPKPLVDSYVETLEASGLSVQALEMESLAICRAVLDDPYPEQPTLLIDLGGSRTTVIIVAHRSIQFSSSLPFSGSQLTARLSQAQHLSLDDAERLKCLYGIDPVRAKGAIAKVLRLSIEGLVDALKKHILFYHNHFADAGPLQTVLLTGGGAQMHGIQRTLGMLLDLPVSLGKPLLHITGTVQIPLVRLPSFTTAIGLALRTP